MGITSWQGTGSAPIAAFIGWPCSGSENMPISHFGSCGLAAARLVQGVIQSSDRSGPLLSFQMATGEAAHDCTYAFPSQQWNAGRAHAASGRSFGERDRCCARTQVHWAIADGAGSGDGRHGAAEHSAEGSAPDDRGEADHTRRYQAGPNSRRAAEAFCRASTVDEDWTILFCSSTVCPQQSAIGWVTTRNPSAQDSIRFRLARALLRTYEP